MKFRDKLTLWLIGLLLLCLFVYSVRSILLPFIVAIIAAYFFDPAAGKLQKLGLSRLIATTIITALFFTVAITFMILLAPVLYNQFLNLVNAIPEYTGYINDTAVPRFAKIIEKIDPHALEKIKSSISELSTYALTLLAKLASNVWNSGIALLNLLSILFITPVVTFYMLRDWNKILDKINSWLPVKYAQTIREQAKEINHTLSGYIRGQTHVCLILGTCYVVALSLTGLEFSLFIGLANGLLLFIPYVGALLGFSVGILVAFFQFGYSVQLGIVVAIFLTGQVLEGVFITPNLVGNKVGLHPVWIMFGLLAGGAMFGFVGILVAVPITAIIGVLVRFFLGEYLKGR